ncbi:MAG: Gfo/Idh/MocA family oxidoreductase [Phycisphaerae bacterium]|nr:Gfo/Idh/MocA family oxidoreductase [Phycisphaerae bacterium]
MIRMGIAGAGGLGRVHWGNFANDPRVAVVAIADLMEDRRQGRLDGVNFNIKQEDKTTGAEPARAYSAYAELCTDPNVDAVCICLPTDLHCDATIRALEAGKHVLCEKPIALTPADGRKMLATAAAANRTLMVGHCLRFWPEYEAVEQAIRDGRYGRVLAASFTRVGNVPYWGRPDNWFTNMQRSGGPVIDVHIHDADLCVAWWGRPDDVSVGGSFAGDLPNMLHSRWRYANGPAVQFETGWDPIRGGFFYFGFKISFERAVLAYDSRNDRGLQLFSDGDGQVIETAKTSAYEAEDRYFIDCLTKGLPVDRCPPQQSLLSLECVAQEARRLAEACGRPWPLPGN